MIYLDNAATTPLHPEVARAMAPWLSEGFANASSLHGPGVEAAAMVDAAALPVAALAGPGPWEVVFTSGGTEANALGILGSFRRGRARRVVTTAIEHPSILGNVARLGEMGAETIRVAPTPAGSVDAAAVIDAVDASTVLVSLMHGNNEIGTLLPVEEACREIKARHPSTLVHVDAVQTAGRLPLATTLSSVDMVTLSAHKMHGPKGAGALLVRRGSRRPTPLYRGGDQQAGIRPGTENVPAIAGFGAAARLAAQTISSLAPLMQALEAAFMEALGERPACTPAFREGPRVPGHIALRLIGVPAEPVIHAMEARSVIISSGSACHSRSSARSHVLEALGLPADEDVIRIAASHETTVEDMRKAGEALRAVISDLAR
ncbi:MAG: cysteine desulfurase [Deltaproteobacteria bacterium]|nr:cysteine desulfurase [Deltaproteobacteria bacterium]